MNKLKPVEVTGLIPLMRQSGNDLATYEHCDCGGSRECPYCEGTEMREVVARYFMVDTNSTVADVIIELDLSAKATVRLTRAVGILFAIVT
jgi:hypothetical protein